MVDASDDKARAGGCSAAALVVVTVVVVAVAVVAVAVVMAGTFGAGRGEEAIEVHLPEAQRVVGAVFVVADVGFAALVDELVEVSEVACEAVVADEVGEEGAFIN